jgi:hypothetical protein
MTCERTPTVPPEVFEGRATRCLAFDSICSAAQAIDWPKNPDETPISIIITSRNQEDVAKGIAATKMADDIIAANSGFFIPNL